MPARVMARTTGARSAGCYIGNMRQLYFIAAAAAMVLATACGASSPAPVKAPSRVDDVVTRATPGPRRRDLPAPLVAPPPAYGNKIVMAQRNTTSRVQ